MRWPIQIGGRRFGRRRELARRRDEMLQSLIAEAGHAIVGMDVAACGCMTFVEASAELATGNILIRNINTIHCDTHLNGDTQ